jgi:hypothetical protein
MPSIIPQMAPEPLAYSEYRILRSPGRIPAVNGTACIGGRYPYMRPLLGKTQDRRTLEGTEATESYRAAESCNRSLWVARKRVFLMVPSVVLRIAATVFRRKPW